VKGVVCREVVALLSAEVDNELPPEQSHAVRTHLTSCPECARRSELLRDTREAFQSLANELAVGPRYVITAALAAAMLAAAVVGSSILRMPGPAQEPLRHGNAAVDCGIGGSSACVVEASPCSGGECALLLVPQAE
jgi:putative zinc finger protein